MNFEVHAALLCFQKSAIVSRHLNEIVFFERKTFKIERSLVIGLITWKLSFPFKC